MTDYARAWIAGAARLRATVILTVLLAIAVALIVWGLHDPL